MGLSRTVEDVMRMRKAPLCSTATIAYEQLERGGNEEEGRGKDKTGVEAQEDDAADQGERENQLEMKGTEAAKVKLTK